MIELDWIQACVRTETYLYSAHADKERMADSLMLTEIEEAVQNGIIIEQYANTGRGASYLLAGFTALGKPIHIVTGRKGEQMVIITVYIPTPPKFLTPFNRNRP